MADNIYTRHWDHYVDRTLAERRDEDLWPGDEWGDPAAWERLFSMLFVDHGLAEWRRAVEIGQGAGKYTLKTLRNPNLTVRAYDVSARFLGVCAERCRDHVDSGRLQLRELDTATPAWLFEDLSDWHREIDAVYSIDAMVHVDLQYMMAYLLTAAAALKPNGKLILTLASMASERGFRKLLEDVTERWGDQHNPMGPSKFEWMSGNQVAQLLPRLGFEIDLLWEPEWGNSLGVVASLTHPEVGDELAGYLRNRSPRR